MDIERIADLLGLEKVRAKGKELSARCPLHDDRHRSFSMDADTGAWNCFSG